MHKKSNGLVFYDARYLVVHIKHKIACIMGSMENFLNFEMDYLGVLPTLGIYSAILGMFP